MPHDLARPSSTRLASIDLLRGTVMLLMLLDHVRETFYLHHQVGDPVDAATVSPALFACRLLAHLCAPVFVFLTGLSAWLYASRAVDARRTASAFLLKRGLFLVLLELTVVSVAWNGEWPAQRMYLQVIWAIGISMIALAGLLWLTRPALLATGLVIVAGHNLLDGLHVGGDGALAVLWKLLHQRDWIALGGGIQLRTSYPLLPWIGVIALGYAAGPWFGASTPAPRRQRDLLVTGIGLLLGFALLRWLNLYGDAPWQAQADALRTLISVFNVTKYPPSLLFLLLTLGVGLLLLRLYEHPALARRLAPLADIGAAPMFFYLLHLYLLKLLYVIAYGLLGPNQGQLYGFSHVASLWLTSALLAVALYLPVRGFARLKARRRDLAWLRYL